MTVAIPELDVSARTALLLAGFAAGRSHQPNLLTRGTRDQAIITGVAAASTYGWGASVHSFLRTVAHRLPLPSKVAGPLVDAAAAGVGLAALRAFPPPGKRTSRQSVGHLAALGLGGVGVAGLLADSVELARGHRGGRALAVASLVGFVGWSYLQVRPGRASFGSDLGDGHFRENVTRSVSPGKSAALGVGTGLALVGLSHAESALATGVSHVAAAVLGGAASDHRTLGRIGATLATYGLGWAAVAKVSAMLSTPGQAIEPAYRERPTAAEITGSAASGRPWDIQTREGARWLSATLTPAEITEVMGEPSQMPIRVYASLESADSEEARAQVLLDELDRTDAFARSHLALFSPTGSGYVNYVATESFEFLTRGDCASAAIQYAVLPSALSLTRAEGGTRQTRLVMDGIAARLRELPPQRRPKVYLFGESLGCRVSQEAFTGATDLSLRAIGFDAALWVGTPAFTEWRQRIWGGRTQAQPPEVGPEAVYLPRDISDWQALPPEQRAEVRYLLLQHGDDPVPKFDSRLSWSVPDWLGPDASRPPGAPRGTTWQPVTTFITTFIDLMNALVPTPGYFDFGGHDYRAVIPEALATVWRLPADEAQMARMYRAMEDRELAWEVRRVTAAAAAKPEREREAAEQTAQVKVSELYAAQAACRERRDAVTSE